MPTIARVIVFVGLIMMWLKLCVQNLHVYTTAYQQYSAQLLVLISSFPLS